MSEKDTTLIAHTHRHPADDLPADHQAPPLVAHRLLLPPPVRGALTRGAGASGRRRRGKRFGEAGEWCSPSARFCSCSCSSAGLRLYVYSPSSSLTPLHIPISILMTDLLLQRGIGYGIGLAFALFAMQEVSSLMSNHYYMSTSHLLPPALPFVVLSHPPHSPEYAYEAQICDETEALTSSPFYRSDVHRPLRAHGRHWQHHAQVASPLRTCAAHAQQRPNHDNDQHG